MTHFDDLHNTWSTCLKYGECVTLCIKRNILLNA